MNTILIKGRLSHSPELKEVEVKGEKRAVCHFDVAVNRRFGDEADFFKCQVWGKTAEFVKKFFEKGQEILVQGEMSCRKWQDNDGNNRYAWELSADRVEFCGSKKDNSKPDVPEGFTEIEDDDENIPF